MAKKSKVYIILSLLLFVFLFFNAGFYLNLNRQSAKSSGSIAFLLVGDLKDRVLALSEIYKSGEVDSVVYANTLDTDYNFLDSLDVVNCRNSDKIKEILTKLGIPSNKIIQLDAQTKSTIDEANALRDFLKIHPEVNKVTLVTSSYHSRRAYLIVKDRLESMNRNIIIDVYPSTYSHVNIKYWWKNKEAAVHISTEYIKLLSFYLIEQWR